MPRASASCSGSGRRGSSPGPAAVRPRPAWPRPASDSRSSPESARSSPYCSALRATNGVGRGRRNRHHRPVRRHRRRTRGAIPTGRLNRRQRTAIAPNTRERKIIACIAMRATHRADRRNGQQQETEPQHSGILSLTRMATDRTDPAPGPITPNASSHRDRQGLAPPPPIGPGRDAPPCVVRSSASPGHLIESNRSKSHPFYELYLPSHLDPEGRNPGLSPPPVPGLSSRQPLPCSLLRSDRRRHSGNK